MLYVFGAMLLAIFALGGVASCEHNIIVGLEASALSAKMQSEAILAQNKVDLAKAKKDGQDYAQNLDAGYLKTVDFLNGELAAARKSPRLYDARGTCSASSVPASGPVASSAPNPAVGCQFSEEAGEFLRSEARRANGIVALTNLCLEFTHRK